MGTGTTLILAEKPSVARDIAKAFKQSKKGDNCIYASDPELGKCVITWAAGHLYELDNSELIPRGVKQEQLPIVPKKFIYTPRKGTSKLIRAIRKNLKNADRVVIATDAGREGELIARLILMHAGWKDWNRTYRFWTSEALTPAVVRKTLKKLKKASEFDSLYHEALARQHGDWVFGINASIAARFKMGSNTSVGRVQTPVLRLIVDRYHEHVNFKPEEYWVIKVKCSKDNSSFVATWVNKGVDPRRLVEEAQGGDDEQKQDQSDFGSKLKKEEAEAILKLLRSHDVLVVDKVVTKEVKQQPPLLHSLTTLQREANQLYGFSAQKTLNIAQALYEKHKVLSYPRTDAQYLGEANRELVASILAKLGKKELIPAAKKAGKRVFNDKKLTDHHALIPLAPPPKELTPDERKIYDLVYRRFVGAFMGPFVYERTVVVLKTPDGRAYFTVSGKKVKEYGWKDPSLYRSKDESYLPPLKAGEEVAKDKEWSEKKYTQPPPLYTEGAVLKLMEKLGLGTPATRASIIETLKKRQYVFVKKGKLVPTEKGLELIRHLGKYEFASPDMTSKWEEQLHSIYKQRLGEEGYKRFVAGIVTFTAKAVKDILSSGLRRVQLKQTVRRKR